MKKIFLFTLFVFLLCITAITVSADSPPPPPPPNYLYCYIQNAPADAVYFDILIEITPQNDDYKAADYNIKPVDSKIALYNEDGYMSLTFHYKNLECANNKIESLSFKMKDSNLSIDKVSPTIKAVLLDKDGNILQVSNAISTAPKASDEYAYSLTYDASGMILTLQFIHSEKSSTDPNRNSIQDASVMESSHCKSDYSNDTHYFYAVRRCPLCNRFDYRRNFRLSFRICDLYFVI